MRISTTKENGELDSYAAYSQRQGPPSPWEVQLKSGRTRFESNINQSININLNPNLTHEEQAPNLGFHQTTIRKGTTHTC